VSFGANDTTIDAGVERVELDRSCAALGDLLERARAIGLPPLVIGPAPVDDAEQNRRIQRLSGVFADMCTENGTPFVGVVEPLLASETWREQVARDDGAHPAAEGYAVLAELVLASGWADWLRGDSIT
jgi:lysophospholipase L1-like esterase